MVFVGVIDPIDPMVETTVQVRERVLEAASLPATSPNWELQTIVALLRSPTTHQQLAM